MILETLLSLRYFGSFMNSGNNVEVRNSTEQDNLKKEFLIKTFCKNKLYPKHFRSRKYTYLITVNVQNLQFSY